MGIGEAPEQELVERARSGDINAFEEIYRRYCGMAYSVAYRITSSVPDSQEVVQDVFVAAHKALKDFRGGSSLKTWLYRITVNRALNAVKKSRRVRSRELLFDHDMEPENAPDAADPSAEKEAARAKAEALLASLDPDRRACLTLRAVEGLSYAEISAALGININTVRSRLKRARESLLTMKGESA